MTLTWTASNGNYLVGNHNTKWAVYRNGEYYKYILQDSTATSVFRGESYKPYNGGTYTFYDDEFPYEEDVKYEVYYVWKEWDATTDKAAILKSNEMTVGTYRTVPIGNLEVVSNEGDIEFQWTSTSYAEEGWGNKFKVIMIDPNTNEETLLCTIVPKANQGTFKWVHRSSSSARTTTEVAAPQGSPYPVVYYTDEPLNVCIPHHYRIEGIITNNGVDKVLNSQTVERRSIGTGTLFTSIDATKGTYPGTVKLSWAVDRRGDDSSKEYKIERRPAEMENLPWDYIESISSSEQLLRYTDATALPGVYYEYRISVIDKCDDGNLKTNSQTVIGFAQTTGTVSGRVTYGTSGTSVENVEVLVKKANASDADGSQYHSVHFTGENDYIAWTYPNSDYAANKFSSGDFTIQMWLYPEVFVNKWVVRFHDNKALGIFSDRHLLFCDGTQNYDFSLYMNTDKYSHVTLTRSGNTLTCYLIEFDQNGKPIVQKSTQTLQRPLPLGDALQFEVGYFKGFVDELRLWTRCLSETEIVDNCDHLLVGNESGLETYWTFDEGLSRQFFDYSREGTSYHQHHGTMMSNTKSATTTPSQLALKAKTDEDGNYVIQGIPFSGEGTNFNIIPMLNSHEFSPQKQSRFISSSSQVHNSVDFTDISSFEVSGTILYAGTNIPVDSVQMCVDGRPVTRNNEAVVTNAEGYFIIDVPIGRHYISAVKDGHTFVNNGRIPEDPTGLNETTLEFTNPMSGLRFIDTTLVPVAGRVVGGAIEGDKPVGFGLSENTIGKAVITLEIPDTRYMLNAEERMDENDPLVSTGYWPVATTTPLTSPAGMSKPGEAYRTGGQYENDAKRVVITTDATTGEFGVMLPPLDYKVVSVEMENEQARNLYTFPSEQLPRIDATDPTTVLQDSIEAENGGYRYFDYVALFKQTIHSTPILDVTQHNASPGAFGDRQSTYTIPGTNERKVVSLYTLNGNNVNYTFGYPIFTELGTYKFLLEGYENYMNYEKGIETKVPLKDVVVTISNAMSSTQEVYNADVPNDAGKIHDLKSNQLVLDSLGKATYTWKAGLPNIQGDFTRTLNMTYNNGAGEYSWQGLYGIIFGDLPSGTNFTTKGPSTVEMILHDPYGDSSFTTWETGKVTIQAKDSITTFAEANNLMVNLHAGADIVTDTHTLYCSVQNEYDFIADVSNGFDRLEQKDTIGSTTTTLEVTKAISTSSDPAFVGADGDIYIGKSTNLIFGNARSVGLKANVNGEPEVMVDNVIVMGKQFATNFVYTQYQIENVIIPNLLTLRNDLLTQVADSSTFTNTSNTTVYATELSPDDENFGEEGTYKTYFVKNDDGSPQLNMVLYYNEEIKKWRDEIALNEEYKMKTIREVKGSNISFGGGSEYAESTTNTVGNSYTISRTTNWTYNLFIDLGFTWNGMGGDVETTYNLINENGSSTTTEEENSTTFSYTLADSGADDSFSVNIYPASGNHSPMFRTEAGQSSCPYEGQALTKYYKNEQGKPEVLSEATMQIEQPELTCNNNMLTGVPTGGQAQFELLLRNNSITNTDCYFNLIPLDGNNPKGARLSLPTGPIENGRTVFVPAGETVRMILTLEQVNTAVTKYDDIKLALTSTCQEDLRSEVSISAEFVPASTPVIMAIDKRVVNISNVDDGVQMRVTGFDRYFAGLQRVDLQYMAPGEQTWSLLKGYIPSENVRTDNSQELLPENGVIELPINMRDAMWAKDGTYKFRAQSATIFSGSTITSESDELTVVKDLKRPQLFGAASPSDGVLNSGDEIGVTFNEDIQKEMLTKNNIFVSGVLNGYKLQHDVALSAQSTERAAYTQTMFNLAKKSFSGDIWVLVNDNANEVGDIFTHGNGNEKFKLSIDANDKLVATIGDQSYTSAEAIEKGTWTFLTFSYNYEQGSSQLSARAVTANDTKDLFEDLDVADYAGTGSITLGQHFSGAMHELTLWDKARTMQEAQAEMNITKKPSTPNLIGYWKMDEGEGQEIRDYARSRNLTMPNATWYLNNDNKAVSLDGTNSLKVSIAACNPQDTEDYAVELWFKGDNADQSAPTTLFSGNSESVGVGFTAGGGLTMKANGADTELCSQNYLDNAWHHFALNVVRNGNATAYVDGKAVKTFSASAVPSLQGAWLYVGSNQGNGGFFKGTVDEIRVWKASLTGDLISSQRTQRLNGDESGLEAYYSFEKLTRDPNNGIISSVSNTNDLCTGTLQAQMESGSISFTDVAPALKVKPEATNVEYNFVANERGIVITLNETPDRLEGSTLQFTVRSVQDLNGNESSPAIWTAFVRQNSLLWKSDTEVTLEKQVGETATFEATFANESGVSENWTLNGLPSWLSASATSGTLKAQLSKTVTFTVSGSVPTGKYEETIYLTGNNNVSEPLTLNLKVKAEEPDWAVNPADYYESVNLIGALQILNVPCRDEDDIVAAFIGNECRGVAHPEYMDRYDGYFVIMDIYGSDGDTGLPVTFKVFEASTGVIYPVVNTSVAVTFKPDELMGTFRTPVILNATDEVEQNIDLANGWTWTSFAVKPDIFTVEKVFGNTDGKVVYVKNKAKSAEYDGSLWLNDIPLMNNTDMYVVQSTDNYTLNVTGHRVDSSQEYISVGGGQDSEWTWVAFNSLSVMNLNEALNGMNPQDHEIIKGQRGVAYYDAYEWVGSLRQLTPGKGYKIYAKEERTFSYPNKTAYAASRIAMSPEYIVHNTQFTPVDYRNYPANMVLIAQVVGEVSGYSQPLAGVELGVFAGDECREAAVTDERGMVYITIPGDEPCELTFRTALNGQSFARPEGTLAQPVGARMVNGQSITYETDAVVGTPKAPYIIDLNAATGIADINARLNGNGDVYDLQGRRVGTAEANSSLFTHRSSLKKGVYIINGQKKTVK